MERGSVLSTEAPMDHESEFVTGNLFCYINRGSTLVLGYPCGAPPASITWIPLVKIFIKGETNTDTETVLPYKALNSRSIGCGSTLIYIYVNDLFHTSIWII